MHETWDLSFDPQNQKNQIKKQESPISSSAVPWPNGAPEDAGVRHSVCSIWNRLEHRGLCFTAGYVAIGNNQESLLAYTRKGYFLLMLWVHREPNDSILSTYPQLRLQAGLGSGLSKWTACYTSMDTQVWIPSTHTAPDCNSSTQKVGSQEAAAQPA